MNTIFIRKRIWIILSTLMLFALILGIYASPISVQATSTVLVDNLQPSWTAPGGGGVFSAYVGPPAYGYVSPGTTALYDGREAGIIKAGLTPDPDDGHYWDEGLFAFIPNISIDVFAAGPVTYDVENETGSNPVWMTIEIDTGTVGDRGDNTTYQHVPTSNPAGWHTVDAAAGLWQKWNNNDGDVSGNPLISLSDVATAHTGLNVVRTYLRLGMGDSYHGTGSGTIGWVDKVTIGSVTYDFILAKYWYVATTGSDTNEGTLASPFLTIQHAVDMAGVGDTIHVAAGTYEEQVEITKSLTLQGAGSTTIIKSPVTLTKSFVTSTTNKPVVYIHDTVGVTVQDLMVDGAGRGNSNYRFSGIAFRNAGGTVQTVEIKDVRDTPFSGAQHGVALYAYNDDTTSRTINVYDSTFTGFQKNAMALNASDTTPLVVDVDGNTVTGAGATTVTAQNGIQVWGALVTGEIVDNTISGIAYDNTSATTKWVATSILNYYGDVAVTENTISGAHMGVYHAYGIGDITENDLTIEKVGVSAYGLLVVDPPEVVPSPFGEDEASPLMGEMSTLMGPLAPVSTLNIDIYGNTVVFSGIDNTATYGIEADAGYTTDNLSVTVNDNTIDGFEAGIEFYQCQSGCSSGTFTALSAYQNCLSDNTFGIRSNADYLTVDGDNNSWGDASGPFHAALNPSGTGDAVSDYIDFEPWITDGCGGTTTGGNWLNTTTNEYDDLQDSLDNALPGEEIKFVGGDVGSGGATTSVSGVTINLNGGTFGPGSPFLTVSSADITLLGPGILDGDGSSDPAVMVTSGGNNFIMEDVEDREWADGVEVDSSVESFKLVGNWIHTNTDAGLQIDSGVALTGIVTIEGNLFKVNTGNGIQNDSGNMLEAEYNSWGDIGGPNVGVGDGVSTNVDYDPWTFAEFFMDVDPDSLALTRSVSESQDFDVKLKADAEKLFGFSFKITYDPSLVTWNSLSTTFASPWSGACDQITPVVTGTISYFCNLTSLSIPPEWDATAGEIAKFNFTATPPGGNGPWSMDFDIAHLVADTSAGAIGGVKVFVNNAGYNDPSSAERDITDAQDGKININGIANYTGFIDLQGRTNDSGALVEVFDQQTIAGSTKLASGTSASSGKYTTVHETGELLVISNTDPYWFQVDRWLFLPTTRLYTPPATDYADSKLLLDRPLTSLETLLLLGGDATNNDYIDILDASCIGWDYGTNTSTCSGTGSSSDVTGNGSIDILDLTLMGGNYYLAESPWTP